MSLLHELQNRSAHSRDKNKVVQYFWKAFSTTYKQDGKQNCSTCTRSNITETKRNTPRREIRRKTCSTKRKYILWLIYAISFLFSKEQQTCRTNCNISSKYSQKCPQRRCTNSYWSFAVDEEHYNKERYTTIVLMITSFSFI